MLPVSLRKGYRCSEEPFFFCRTQKRERCRAVGIQKEARFGQGFRVQSSGWNLFPYFVFVGSTSSCRHCPGEENAPVRREKQNDVDVVKVLKKTRFHPPRFERAAVSLSAFESAKTLSY